MEVTEVVNVKQFILFALVVPISPVSSHEKQNELIYILQWTYTSGQGWIYRDLEMGQEAFTSRNCSFQNCFITTNRSYLTNIVDYDVLLFNAVHFAHFPSDDFPLPTNRSEAQLYILACVEPAGYNHLPDYLNGIFNLTWTYKLDSDIVHPYIIVKNNNDEIIGPKLDASWIDINDLPPLNSSIIQKLQNKHLAAVWVGSDCYAKDRIIYIIQLENELRSKFGLQLDIFGKCGNGTACESVSRERIGLLTSCYDKIESDYYFYLAFENSISEDYISEKILHGLNHFTVPIVYGGADYKRFLPDGMYLDAIKLGVEGLAKEMYDIINDPPRYYDFFKWHGFYTFHDTGADNYSYTVCELCAFFNNEKRQINRIVRVYDNLIGWWNVPVTETFPHVFSFRDININHVINIEITTSTEAPQIEEPEPVTSYVVSYLLNYLSGD